MNEFRGSTKLFIAVLKMIDAHTERIRRRQRN